MRTTRSFLLVLIPAVWGAAAAFGCGDDSAPGGAASAEAGAPDVVTQDVAPPNPADGSSGGSALPFRGPLSFSSLHSHTCSLEDGGSVRCWGANNQLQSGAGSGNKVATPKLIEALTDAIEVSAGGQMSCALRATKQVVCWGSNAFGQLGQADAAAPEFSARPLEVPGLANIRAVAAGDTFACAVKEDKTVVCWGRNEHGQLGGPVGQMSDVPVAVPGITDVEVLAAGPNQACVVKTDKTVACWGRAKPPAPEDGITKAVSVAVGLSHACALLEDRTVVCWGPASIPANTITDAIAIRAGFSHTCVLRQGGTVQCWGKNELGALGSGSSDPESKTPVDVTGVNDAVDLTAGLTFGCVRRAGGEKASCWGNNDVAQLGAGADGGSSSVPVDIVGY